MAGAYVAALRGADCPFASGPIQLVQRGGVVEGTRGGRLLLWGALGATQAAFLVTEQRFVKVTRNGIAVTVEVPDRPSELYAAPLGAPTLVLGGRERKTCTITLARGSSGVK